MDWRLFVYGGLASITAEFGTFPIDTTKTRLQIQGQKIDASHSQVRYRGMIHAFLQISREEGARALYYGIWPAVLRQATYGTIKFGTYYSLKNMIMGEDSSKSGGGPRSHGATSTDIACAVIAGAVSSAIANPTDVLKVRMQARPASIVQPGGVSGTAVAGVAPRDPRTMGLVACFVNVYQQEGIRGLWRGVGPTSQRAGVIAGVELPVYDFCKHHLTVPLGDTVSNHFVSSLIASLGSAVSSTPLDVIRTRLMNQKKLITTTSGVDHPRIYTGSIDCFLQTVRNEGFMALYKGFVPTWFRMGPWNIIFFITFEQLKQVY